MPKPKITKNRFEKIRHKIPEMTIQEITEELGCCYKHACRFCHDAKLRPRGFGRQIIFEDFISTINQRYDKSFATKNEMFRGLYSEFPSAHALAEIFGVAKSIINRELKEAGVVMIKWARRRTVDRRYWQKKMKELER